MHNFTDNSKELKDLEQKIKELEAQKIPDKKMDKAEFFALMIDSIANKGYSPRLTAEMQARATEIIEKGGGITEIGQAIPELF